MDKMTSPIQNVGKFTILNLILQINLMSNEELIKKPQWI